MIFIYLLITIITTQGLDSLTKSLEDDFKLLKYKHPFDAIHLYEKSINKIIHVVRYKTFNYGIVIWSGKLDKKTLKLFILEDKKIDNIISKYINESFCEWYISKNKYILFIWDLRKNKTKSLNVRYSGSNSESMKEIFELLFKSICRYEKDPLNWRIFDYINDGVPFLLMWIDSVIDALRHLCYNNVLWMLFFTVVSVIVIYISYCIGVLFG